MTQRLDPYEITSPIPAIRAVDADTVQPWWKLRMTSGDWYMWQGDLEGILSAMQTTGEAGLFLKLASGALVNLGHIVAAEPAKEL